MTRITGRSRDAARNLTSTILCLVLLSCTGNGQVSSPPAVLPFTTERGSLITNEYAYWNTGDPWRVESPVWEMTGGSLFAQGDKGWSGRPDAIAPNSRSTNGSGSDIFRLTTKRSDFTDTAVSFDLLNRGLSSTERTPPVEWDGVHVFLRYQSEFSLYYASINRRDGNVTIKKKVPGGESNGGTYHDLAPLRSAPVRYGAWQHVRATVENLRDGSVRIVLAADGRKLVSAVDKGVGGPPITGAGKVGIRGDNCDFLLAHFETSYLPTQ